MSREGETSGGGASPCSLASGRGQHSILAGASVTRLGRTWLVGGGLWHTATGPGTCHGQGPRGPGAALASPAITPLPVPAPNPVAFLLSGASF